MNPFKYGCVVSGENFCPRPELARQLQEFASAGQNLVIQGTRRIGKTSLVRNAIGGMRRMRLIYIDLYYIKTVADFCSRVMKGVAKASDDLRQPVDRRESRVPHRQSGKPRRQVRQSRRVFRDGHRDRRRKPG